MSKKVSVLNSILSFYLFIIFKPPEDSGRAIFLCFFLLIVQKKEGKSEYSWNLSYNFIKRFGQSWNF